MRFEDYIDQMSTDPDMDDLGEYQIEAVINVLSLTLYADQSAGVRQTAEFEDLLYKLPWFEGKWAVVKDYTLMARERFAQGVSLEDIQRILAEAANYVKDASLREHIFEMAASLACVDLQLHPGESQLLQVMIDAFELDRAAAEASLERLAAKTI